MLDRVEISGGGERNHRAGLKGGGSKWEAVITITCLIFPILCPSINNNDPLNSLLISLKCMEMYLFNRV